MYKFTLFFVTFFLGVGVGFYGNRWLGEMKSKEQWKARVAYAPKKDQIKKDLVGHRVTMENGRRWLFTEDQDIFLAPFGGGTGAEVDEIDDGSMVTYWRVLSRPQNKEEPFLSGFINVRYEWVINQWKLTEVTGTMGSLRSYFEKKKEEE